MEYEKIYSNTDHIMIKILKKIVKEICPKFILRLIRYLFFKKPGTNIIVEIEEDISKLRQSFNSDIMLESVIIGNGPSFNDFMKNHKNFLKDKTVFCVNNFASSAYFEIIKPQFYVIADEVYWNKIVSNETLKAINKTILDLKEKVNWKLIILIPNISKNWSFFLNLPKENDNISIAYYNNLNHDILKNRFALYKKNKAMPQCQTVLVSALFFSLNLGFKTNYLVGGDMSFHKDIIVNKNNVVCRKLSHFYGEETTFNPFLSYNKNNDTHRMGELFLAFSLMHNGFDEMEEYSKFLHAKIYNLGSKSFIDAFEKIEL
ncbi:MAG: hypothetical protein ACJAYY_000295 [Paraglaciecola sp.]|jgi:hypothetical protein|uniref:hypothetical protein n=1 Tax=Polaribacter sp. TaxID=1920175 RepID=UPI003AD254A2